jgi:hypothetical protein
MAAFAIGQSKPRGCLWPTATISLLVVVVPSECVPLLGFANQVRLVSGERFESPNARDHFMCEAACLGF